MDRTPDIDTETSPSSRVREDDLRAGQALPVDGGLSDDAAVLRLAHMTYAEVQALERERAVPILPVGAIEAHGPHLPLVTDGIIARAMAEQGAVLLRQRGWTPLLLEPLVYTPAAFARNFTGTLPIRPETLTALLMDLATGLASQGFRWLALANAHLDPEHLGALYAAVEGCDLTVVFADLSRKPWALRMTEEFKSGACHAGRYEGSVVMAVRPDLVREPIRLGLAPNPASLSAAIRRGATSFEESGGPRAYFGDPAAASAGEGREIIEVMGAILADAVEGVCGATS